ATTYDGARIPPLYTSADETGERPLPGTFPYVRGTDAQRDVTAGWHVDVRYGDDGSSAAEVNEQILDGLANGVSAVTLSCAGGLGADAIGTVLRGVHLDLAPVSLDFGDRTADAAQAL